jgi:hypothetical protein
MTPVFTGESYILCADANRFISMLDMQSVFIGIGIHGDNLNSKLFASSHNADGNLATIGDQYLFEHIHSKFWMK